MNANETMPLGVVVEATFKFEKETKGALRFQEIDENGKVIEQARSKQRRRLLSRRESV